MNSTTTHRIVLPLIAIVAAGGMTLVGTRQIHHESPVDGNAVATSPADAKAPSEPENSAPGGIAAAQAEANGLANALTSPPAPVEKSDELPSFDIARVEPTGEAVIAGRAPPGTTVELLRDGEPHDRALVDPSGQFAMVPPPLPPGTHQLTLRVRRADGSVDVSKQNLAVVLEPKAKDGPVVALVAPDKPTIVLSQPLPPASGAAQVAVDAMDIEPHGKLNLSAHARAGAAVRIYLDDRFVASLTADADGRLATTIDRAMGPGSHHLRLDELEANSGTVRSRAEVPLDIPKTIKTASLPPETMASTRPRVATAKLSQLRTHVAALPPSTGSRPGKADPKITTTTVSRGDSLWLISRRALGNGERYAVIYKTNRRQIRNPNLIYPGQVLELPTR
jgi:nucleoid-associated protein YgaU